MKNSGFKRKIALLLTLAFTSAYIVGPIDGVRTVYAASAQTGSASVPTSQAAAPTITTQPKNVTASPGDTVKFTVSAKGTGTLKYQWYIRKDGASDWSLWNGHTTASTSASANATWNMMQVRCKVTDANGSVTSSVATVTIEQPLKILTQPKGMTVPAGADVTFSVTAQGSGKMMYQWYYKKSGASDWSLWKGRTTASITPTSNSTWNLMKVRCEVSDASGIKLYSNMATVTIDQPLSITAQPKNVTAKTDSDVKFSVAAQGKGKLNYQWYYKKDGAADWTLWNGRTAASFTVKAGSTWNLMKVRCKVSDASGSKVYSNAATVTLNRNLTITTQPKNITAKIGEDITFSVKAQGSGELKYQWYFKFDGQSEWSVWNGRTTSSITESLYRTWNLLQVRCQISDALGKKVYSTPATITIDQPLIISAQPKDITAKVGDDSTFSVTAQGSGRLKYQWYYKKDGAAQWSLWNGRTSASIIAAANATWNLMQVRCEITDALGVKITSDAATVTIDQPLTIISQPKDILAKVNEEITFSVKAQGSGKLNYQWYFQFEGNSNWSIWKDRTRSSVTEKLFRTWNPLHVRCEITDASGSKITSDVATVTIDQPLTITSQPKNITAKTGENITFSVAAQGSGVLKYQWYYKFDGKSEWSVWNGRTTPSITESLYHTWNLLQVRCQVSDALGRKINSQAAVISIDRPLTITSPPKDIETKAGQTVSFSVTAQGTGALKYQWYYQKIGAKSYVAWSGKTSASCSAAVDAAWDGMKVYCHITDAAGNTIDTNTVSLIIPGKLRIDQQPADVTVESGGKATFSIKAYCANTIKYQWYFKKAGKKDWTLWSGKTTPEISNATHCTWHGMQVYCKVTDSKGNTLNSNVAYVLITKQGSKRYFTRYISAKANYTKVYDAVGIKSNVVGKIMTKNTYTALDWTSDAGDTTWYCFEYSGKLVWVPRTSVKVTNDYISIPDRKFNDGGIPIIYISPSKQPDNAYAYGSTTEQEQMYRVGNALKKILDSEYYCQTYIPSTTMPLGLHNRAYDAYIRESDVYLAIHSNAISSKAVYGAIGYYAPNCNQSKVLSRNIVSEMNKICIKKSNVTNQLREGMSAFDNTGYGEVRDPAYYGMVGVLAEVEYHDNKDSAKWIIQNTDKIARALANALASTFGLQKK